MLHDGDRILIAPELKKFGLTEYQQNETEFSARGDFPDLGLLLEALKKLGYIVDHVAEDNGIQMFSCLKRHREPLSKHQERSPHNREDEVSDD